MERRLAHLEEKEKVQDQRISVLENIEKKRSDAEKAKIAEEKRRQDEERQRQLEEEQRRLAEEARLKTHEEERLKRLEHIRKTVVEETERKRREEKERLEAEKKRLEEEAKKELYAKCTTSGSFVMEPQPENKTIIFQKTKNGNFNTGKTGKISCVNGFTAEIKMIKPHKDRKDWYSTFQSLVSNSI